MVSLTVCVRGHLPAVVTPIITRSLLDEPRLVCFPDDAVCKPTM